MFRNGCDGPWPIGSISYPFSKRYFLFCCCYVYAMTRSLCSMFAFHVLCLCCHEVDVIFRCKWYCSSSRV